MKQDSTLTVAVVVIALGLGFVGGVTYNEKNYSDEQKKTASLTEEVAAVKQIAIDEERDFKIILTTIARGIVNGDSGNPFNGSGTVQGFPQDPNTVTIPGEFKYETSPGFSQPFMLVQPPTDHTFQIHPGDGVAK